MSSARIEAAARAEYNLRCGLEPDDESAWDELGGQPRAEALARATTLVAAIDAADDRVRLTMPEFHSIKLDTVRDVSMWLHANWDDDQRAAAQAAGVPEALQDYTAKFEDHYLEPINHEAATASLVRERVAEALRTTAEWFDHASLSEILVETDINPAVPPRFKRIMIRGCADWLRTRATDLDAGTRIPYYRVNNRAVIDEDRHTALLGALGRVVDRANRISETHDSATSFIMTDRLVEVIEGVGATLPKEE